MSGDIVITGLGLVLPCGDGFAAARAAWEAQTPAFADLPPALGEGRGAACTAFNPSGIIPPMQLRRLDRPSRFAWVAAHQAFQDAGFPLDPSERMRSEGDPKTRGEDLAIAVGTHTGGSEASEAFMRPYFLRGPEGASPMVFPNCVANAAAGHVALAFGLKGPSSTQLEREAGAFAALDQGLRWLSSGMARAVLVIGTDGLFPLQLELLRRTGLVRRHGLPQAGGGGFLPGEGAQAFLLEPRADAEARGARIRATVAALAGSSGVPEAALQRAAEGVLTGSPEVWIGGASGNKGLDALEGALAAAHPELPPPGHPKRLWGEFCGAGGQLLAAALLTPSASTLVTAPSSLGVQYACCLRDVRV